MDKETLIHEIIKINRWDGLYDIYSIDELESILLYNNPSAYSTTTYNYDQIYTTGGLYSSTEVLQDQRYLDIRDVSIAFNINKRLGYNIKKIISENKDQYTLRKKYLNEFIRSVSELRKYNRILDHINQNIDELIDYCLPYNKSTIKKIFVAYIIHIGKIGKSYVNMNDICKVLDIKTTGIMKMMTKLRYTDLFEHRSISKFGLTPEYDMIITQLQQLYNNNHIENIEYVFACKRAIQLSNNYNITIRRDRIYTMAIACLLLINPWINTDQICDDKIIAMLETSQDIVNDIALIRELYDDHDRYYKMLALFSNEGYFENDMTIVQMHRNIINHSKIDIIDKYSNNSTDETLIKVFDIGDRIDYSLLIMQNQGLINHITLFIIKQWIKMNAGIDWEDMDAEVIIRRLELRYGDSVKDLINVNKSRINIMMKQSDNINENIMGLRWSFTKTSSNINYLELSKNKKYKHMKIDRRRDYDELINQLCGRGEVYLIRTNTTMMCIVSDRIRLIGISDIENIKTSWYNNNIFKSYIFTDFNSLIDVFIQLHTRLNRFNINHSTDFSDIFKRKIIVISSDKIVFNNKINHRRFERIDKNCAIIKNIKGNAIDTISQLPYLAKASILIIHGLRKMNSINLRDYKEYTDVMTEKGVIILSHFI